MWVSDKHAFAWYAPAKTATQTIELLLQQQGPIRLLGPDKHAVVFDRWLSGPGVCRFISIRNPYSRAVSMYHQAAKPHGEPGSNRAVLAAAARALDFAAYLRSPVAAWHGLHQLQSAYLAGMPSVDALVRFEQLHDDLRALPCLSFKGEPPRRNVSSYRGKGKPWHAFYGPAEAALVRRRYALDFEALGYSDRFEDAVAERSTSLAAVRRGHRQLRGHDTTTLS